jgi:signal transduction histidine kinase
MQNLINDLLSFSRTNNMELSFSPCDLNNILREAKNFHIENIQEKSAIIESKKLPTVNGICNQFSQLFSNLIDNSIKYSKLGTPPHIKIT